MTAQVLPLRKNSPWFAVTAQIVRDHARTLERERLSIAYTDHLHKGRQLVRQAQQCNEAARECFETAKRIQEQLEAI